MKKEKEVRLKQPDSKLRSALILGATGATGFYLLRELLASPNFDKVTAITRSSLASHQKLNNVVWPDFSNVLLTDKTTVLDTFIDHDVVFCCLGAPESALLRLFLGSKKARAQFKLVDLDYVVAAADAAYNSGVTHFSVISSPGAKLNAWFSYLQYKGQMEAAIGILDFQGTSIFRPYHLMKSAKTEELGFQRIKKNVIAWIASIMPAKQEAIEVETLAKAIYSEYEKRLSGLVVGHQIYLADDVRELIVDD